MAEFVAPMLTVTLSALDFMRLESGRVTAARWTPPVG
jgi:hypothetical protein